MSTTTPWWPPFSSAVEMVHPDVRSLHAATTASAPYAAKTRPASAATSPSPAATASATNPCAPIPRFEGRIITRGVDADYDAHTYQYARSSQPRDALRPAAILYATSVEDVQRAVRHAGATGAALAVRTGGHHYLGSSSTGGDNLVLDMSNRVAWCTFSYDADANVVRCGPALNVGDMNDALGRHGLFLPHGECRQVCMGGHIQCGGYSIIARAFGLLADHVVEFDIVLADASLRTVRRDSTDPDDVELFYAVLGGSPGNLGVLTSVTLRPLKDADHPDSRMLKMTVLYSKAMYQALVQLLCEFNADQGLDADWDMLVTLLSASYPGVSPTPDADVRASHPEEYSGGDMSMFADEMRVWPTVIVVAVIWSNLNGAKEPFSGKQQAVFDAFRDAVRKAKSSVMQLSVLDVAETQPVPISRVFHELLIRVSREFPYPYFKRCWGTTATDLHKNGFAQALAEHFDEVAGRFRPSGVKVGTQMQLYGGRRSRYARKDKQTSLSWRDSTVLLGTGAWYKNFFPFSALGAQLEAWDFQMRVGATMVGERGLFSRQERRFIWGPFSNTQLTCDDGAVPERDVEKDMSRVWPLYHESAEVYERILRTKRLVDPRGVFTPNEFCVGGGRSNS